MEKSHERRALSSNQTPNIECSQTPKERRQLVANRSTRLSFTLMDPLRGIKQGLLLEDSPKHMQWITKKKNFAQWQR